MTSRAKTWSGRLTVLIASTAAVLVAATETSAAEDVVRSIFALFGAVMGDPRPAPLGNPDARFAYADAPPPAGVNILPPMSIVPGPSGDARFCVRLCDGRFFPLSAPAASSAATAARMCAALCPAAKTAIFRGATIEDAMADTGVRYASLTNAFLYRQAIVPGCTCNGKTGFGLAPIDVANDPTLRAGDVVAGADGLKVFTGSRAAIRRTADFTPVASASGLSAEFRRKLATVRVSSGGRY